ncbi:glycosyltransferase family 2 protein [Dyadobacter sandarakinus]|uniref:Glycosyltransferase n=1 Tax=Dyadobacter sandarakinus TaxID=2747268 RepID=A0ABX7IDJ2_9BACT|nr:glycosyltransferase [Dyadobacter sandarakinus]QRR03990.1 glycosyltransferase [Dyadobacter sandarakinus]
MLHEFPDTTLLITHYNRSESLERLLASFEKLQCRFGDIVVSDDGSKPEHQDKLQSLKDRFGFRLVTTPVNRGLGNNINKGQDAVQTEYTLYVQEDFEPADIFPAHFKDALSFMREDPKWDIVRFYAYFTYPTLKPFRKGFSEMVYSFWDWNHLKFYYYSDHPHLRRSSFLDKFGRYPEGIKGDLTEYRMAISFLQKKGRGLFFDDFTKLFYQKNSSDEPSTMERANWKLNQNPAIRLARLLYLRYRWLKNTLDLVFMK